MGFLQHARGGPRFYWATSREPVAFAGAGIAVDISAWGSARFAQVERAARRLFDGAVVESGHPQVSPRLFGGFAFRDDFVPDFAWADFAPAQFLLPHFQLTQIGNEHWLTLNSQVSRDADVGESLIAMRAALAAKIDLLRSDERRATPDTTPKSTLAHLTTFEDWSRSVTTATQHIRDGKLKKVVLSRAAEACFQDAVDVEPTLARLAEQFPDAYRFLFEPRAGQAFFGATPELLCSVHGKQLGTMALAGSARRGRDPHDDKQFADALLNSEKDRVEHDIVKDSIAARLSPISKHVCVGETGVMQLSNIQHLHTPIHAELSRAISAIKLAKRLHPTPALGGDPQDVAMQLIGELEPVTRGWYGAPLGWVDHEMNGAFVVAIRSAVVQNKRAWLYAGAGIVGASDPQREWDETALKFRAMVGALGVGA
jgi:menaquinone-specific isochorismate synthase